MLQLLFFSFLGSGLAACNWEWAGVFHVHETTTLIWTFEKKTISGVVKYADATMNVAIRKASTGNEAGIDSVKTAAEADLAGSLTAAATGATLSANVGYTITFDTSSWMTIVKIPVVAEDNIVIFAQHGPSEFSNTLTNFMQNDHGEAVTASTTEACAAGDDHSGHAHSHGDDHDDHSEEATTTTDRVGEVIAASLITALPTLLGIFLMFSCCPTGGDLMSFILHYGNALAAGILLAAALFLFLPEGSHFLAVGRTEAEAAAVWGATCIAGWLIGALSHLAGDVVKKMCMRDDTAVAVTDGTDYEVKPERKMMWVLGLPIFCGDFCCNLADGFVLGTAFRNCSPGFAWKICGIIIAHELPQEVADIYALINKAGMKWWQATILNLACGTAALWGGLIAYYSDIPLEAEGAILVLAGGVFLYVALTELGPGAAHFFPKTTMPLISAIATMLTFIVGATSIGLILLDHEHCAEGGGHGGHGDSHGDAH